MDVGFGCHERVGGRGCFVLMVGFLLHCLVVKVSLEVLFKG
jgi:hypothetical protein